MHQEYASDKLPEKLVEYLQAYGDARQFRRRAVLLLENNQWNLVCCTVEGFLPGKAIPEFIQSRTYRQAILHEELLTGEECLAFARKLHDGDAQFGDIDLKRGPILQWSTELVPVDNTFMVQAGTVFSLRFAQIGTQNSQNPLLAYDQPYYPYIEDAARDWLPFPEYYGNSDGRNGQVLFLLPEVRAFIAGAVFGETGTLDLSVAGTEIGVLPLWIKGAYWESKTIRHFEAAVSSAKIKLTVPANADRLEYYLIDQTGNVFDFHREDRLLKLSSGRPTLGAIKHALVDQVRNALKEGEGQRVEFKPFVEPEQKLNPGGKKTKLQEVIVTVVAFANADGGHVYLGIDDDCVVTGIDTELQKWAQASVDDSTIDRYIGALKSRIKGAVDGEVKVGLSTVNIDEALVVIIEVLPSDCKPITLSQDCYLYARSGASNRKIPPDQWKNILT